MPAIAAGVICGRCTVSDVDGPEALNAFVKASEDRLTQYVEVNDFTVTVSFRPPDLIVYQELEGKEIDDSIVTHLRNKYGQYYHFIVSVSRNSREALDQFQGSPRSYSDLLQTFSFRMGQHVNLRTSRGNTIPVADFILNRTYGVGKSTDLLFAFNKKKAQGEAWLQMNVNEFGLGIGDLHFRFRPCDLDAVPQIDFKKMTGGKL